MESNFHYPKITLTKENKNYITFYLKGKRYRLYNGSSLGINIYPNSFSEPDRYNAPIYLHLKSLKACKRETYLQKLV